MMTKARLACADEASRSLASGCSGVFVRVRAHVRAPINLVIVEFLAMVDRLGLEHFAKFLHVPCRDCKERPQAQRRPSPWHRRWDALHLGVAAMLLH